MRRAIANGEFVEIAPPSRLVAFAGGASMSTQQLIEGVILDGPNSANAHIASIRAAS